MPVGRPLIKPLADRSCDSFPALCLRVRYDFPYKLYIFRSEQTVPEYKRVLFHAYKKNKSGENVREKYKEGYFI